MSEERMDIIGKLGVQMSLEFAEDHTLIKFIDKGELTKQRKITFIEKETDDLERLGATYGENLAQCFYLGLKHGGKDFSEKVSAYKITAGGLHNCIMTVQFYGNK